MDSVIEVENLVHRFGEVTALQELNLSVCSGEVFAILGPNGAGKTTTVRLLNGLFAPTAGKIRVLGLDPATQGDEIRRQTGVLTETPALYERLTAWQNIEFFGVLAGMPSADWRKRGADLLAFFDLDKRASERVGGFSKGMKQRLALARALLTNPSILFLDEPTSGLDPEAAEQVHTLIQSVRAQQGRTVILCTHNLVEAQRLCDRVTILQHGHVLASGTIDELRKGYEEGRRVQVKLVGEIQGGSSNDLRVLLTGLPFVRGIADWTAAQGATNITLKLDSDENSADLAAFLVTRGYRLAVLQPQDVSLEDVYFKLQNQAKGGNHELA